MNDHRYPHEPVMVNEVLEFLITLPDGIYVDGTVGTGGHSEAICKKISEKGHLICLDMDAEAIRISQNRLNRLNRRITFIKTNFSRMDTALNDLGIGKVNGILLDLGMSSYQLDQSGRGFSFNRDEPLDMRMDSEGSITAKDIINSSKDFEIEKILKDFGEERRARSISRAIVRERDRTEIDSSLQLADLIRAMSRNFRSTGAKDPATRTFQALRITVNRELENLKSILGKVPDLLEKGGRILFLTYHSLEDRQVKQSMVDWEKKCVCPPDLPECVCGRVPLLRRLNRKALRPQKSEIALNPRARSAILRAAERI
jgi:16S rRNA (cytosine1402-N4)-methyltransferase